MKSIHKARILLDGNTYLLETRLYGVVSGKYYQYGVFQDDPEGFMMDFDAEVYIPLTEALNIFRIG